MIGGTSPNLVTDWMIDPDVENLVPSLAVVTSEKRDGNMKVSGGMPTEENRKRFLANAKRVFGERKVVLASVIHRSRVVVVGRQSPDVIRNADGIVTTNPDTVLGVTFADCPPVFLCDPQRNILAVFHGGYKPVISGICENTIAKMASFGARRDHLLVRIGPGICWAHYEFGREASSLFGSFPQYLAFDPEKGKYLVDLRGIIQEILIRNGVLGSRITRNPACTFCNDRLYSARRDRTNPVEAGIVLFGVCQ